MWPAIGMCVVKFLTYYGDVCAVEVGRGDTGAVPWACTVRVLCCWYSCVQLIIKGSIIVGCTVDNGCPGVVIPCLSRSSMYLFLVAVKCNSLTSVRIRSP